MMINESTITGRKFPPDIGGLFADPAFRQQALRTYEAIGRLRQASGLLHNPTLLVAPILGKEAESSSRLEGTRALIEDAFGLGIVDQTPEQREEATEIQNYKLSLQRGIDLLSRHGISEFSLRETHTILLKGTRGEKKGIGQYRRGQVAVAELGSATPRYTPPDPTQVPALMDQLLEFASRDFASPESAVDPIAACGMLHYQFEAIHPFPDGNGRIGRLLITLFFLRQGLIELPILYPSGYFDRNRDEYLDALAAVDRREDWGRWLTIFFRAIEEQAGRALAAAQDIRALFEQKKAKLSRSSKKSPIALLGALETTFRQPLITASVLRAANGLPLSTASRYLSSLASYGLLSPRSKVGKAQVYANQELLDLLKLV